MAHKSKEIHAAYQLKKSRERREAWFFGKSCVDCGSTERLELDHIDPTTKIHHAIWSWSDVRRNEELAKCAPRCYSCHKIKSAAEVRARFKDNPTPLVHGTLAGYEKRGCRCDECLEAMRVARREQRLKRGISPRPRKSLDGVRAAKRIRNTPDEGA
jgi:hypothetical protein